MKILTLLLLMPITAFSQNQDTLLLGKIKSYDGNGKLVSITKWHYDNAGKELESKYVEFAPKHTSSRRNYFYPDGEIKAQYWFTNNSEKSDSTKYVYSKGGFTRIHYSVDLIGDTLAVEYHYDSTNFCFLSIRKTKPGTSSYSVASQYNDSMTWFPNQRKWVSKTFDMLGGIDSSSPESFLTGKRLTPGTLISQKEYYKDLSGNIVKEIESNYFPKNTMAKLYYFDAEQRLIKMDWINNSDTSTTTYSYIADGEFITCTEKSTFGDGIHFTKYFKGGNIFDYIESTSFDSNGVPLSKSMKTWKDGYVVRTKMYYYSDEAPINVGKDALSSLSGRSEYSYVKFKKKKLTKQKYQNY